jgi:hypothetical protein
MRKVLTTAAVALFAISTLTAISAVPANAANIRGGDKCTRLNAKKTYVEKGNRYSYTCVKNPYLNKTRLTWTERDCLEAIKEDTRLRKDLAATKAAGGDISLLGDTSITRLAISMACARGY